MFARLGAKAVLLIIALALIFFSVGLIEFGIAQALRPRVGAAWGDVIAGAIFLVPVLLWALAVAASAPRRARRRTAANPILAALFTALAKETPWIAVVGATLASVAELFLNRNKDRK